MNALPLPPTVALCQTFGVSYSVVIEGGDRPPMRVMLETLEQARRFLHQMELPTGVRMTLIDADGGVMDTRISGDPVQAPAED